MVDIFIGLEDHNSMHFKYFLQTSSFPKVLWQHISHLGTHETTYT